MKFAWNIVAGFLGGALTLAGAAGAQDKPAGQASKPMPGMSSQEPERHHHGDIPVVKAEYPRLGRAQERAQGPLITLEDAEKMARDSNPTLRQAEAEIRAAKARQQQAGLYPNPTVGYTGDEIRGGSVGGGKQGFFVQQTIVTGGKLGLSRNVYAQDAKLAEIETQEQRTRQEAAETQGRLRNTGQADESEVLEAEVEAQRMRMAARMLENTLREEWRSLAAVIGRPEIPLATVAGDLEKGWPELNEEEAVEAIAKGSPAVQIADAAASRAEAALMLRRAGKE